MEKETLEAICFNCNQFFPIIMDEPTEFGICLNDQAFEPFIDELLENPKTASCQELIRCKKFSGEQEACHDFEEMEEGIEIDENSSLGVELSRLIKTGELNIESFKAAVLEEKIRNIDWKTMPVDQYAAQLNNSNPKEQHSAISSLGGLIALENMEAFQELFMFFKQLPSPTTIEEVHFKIEILRHFNHSNARTILIPELIDELYQTPSNNTTRQWITQIFRFLELCPREEIREPLENMLRDKRFSHRVKKKMNSILNL